MTLPRVVLDSGHGGRDPGAIGPTGLREKDVTLAVARLLRDRLVPAVQVRLTRDGDVNPALSARAAMANAWPANALISLHCNAAVNRQAHGVETFHHPGKPGDAPLARVLQSSLIAATGRADRGVKTANFAVVRLPRMPAALVELLFISNPAEEQLLASVEFQARMAGALATGIARFLGVQLPHQEEVAAP